MLICVGTFPLTRLSNFVNSSVVVSQTQTVVWKSLAKSSTFLPNTPDGGAKDEDYGKGEDENHDHWDDY